MTLALGIHGLKCRELNRPVYGRANEWRDDASVEANDPSTLVDHLDTLRIAMVVLDDIVVLSLHLGLDRIERVPDYGIGGSEEETADHGVQRLLVPFSPLVIVCHFILIRSKHYGVLGFWGFGEIGRAHV